MRDRRLQRVDIVLVARVRAPVVLRVVDVDDADDLPHRRLDVVVLVPVRRDGVLPVKVARRRVDKVAVLDPEHDQVIVLAWREVPRVVVPGNRLAVDDDANRVGDDDLDRRPSVRRRDDRPARLCNLPHRARLARGARVHRVADPPDRRRARRPDDAPVDVLELAALPQGSSGRPSSGRQASRS